MSIKEVKDGVMLEVYVKPKSRKFSIELKDNEIVICCTEPPVKGKANKEIERELSKLFRRKVMIVSGHRAPHKRILVYGLNSENVKQAIVNFKG